MRAITLTQPWATLVAVGEKRIETRSWPTSYRGPIAIHAAKGFPRDAQDLCWDEPFRSTLAFYGIDATRTGDASLPRGAIIATATLVDCFLFDARTEAHVRAREGQFAPDRRFGAAEFEADFGAYGAGRFGFVLHDVTHLAAPIPCRGALSLWEVPNEIVAQIATPIVDGAA